MAEAFCGWCNKKFSSSYEADDHATNCPQKEAEIEKIRAGK